MKLCELMEETEPSDGSLIGKTVNGVMISKHTRGMDWMGGFDCSHQRLKSLDGAPTSVETDFSCQGNLLTSLEGAPALVGAGFFCYSNKLTSLKGAPPMLPRGEFSCAWNKLTSLEGAPSSVRYSFLCQDNRLTSLEGIHRILKQIGGEFVARGNPIESHVLGVLLIDRLTKIDLDEERVKDIVNKYLPNKTGRSVLIHCQNELLDAGFEGYAKL